MSSLLNHFKSYIGASTDEDPSGPGAEYNPVLMSEPAVPGKYEGAEPLPQLEETAEGPINNMGAAPVENDEGPEASLDGVERRDLQDFLQLRMQARLKRSEAFQERAMQMARSMR